jgi:hypothetical protein
MRISRITGGVLATAAASLLWIAPIEAAKKEAKQSPAAKLVEETLRR